MIKNSFRNNFSGKRVGRLVILQQIHTGRFRNVEIKVCHARPNVISISVTTRDTSVRNLSLVSK